MSTPPNDSGAPSLSGLPFAKMSGSGNDFVVFDGRVSGAEALTRPEVIRAICDRHNGIGADGVVLLEPGAGPEVRLRYFNSDGSLGELCGNATLCSTALSVAERIASSEQVSLRTDAGLVTGRVRAGEPEIDLAPVHEVMPVEQRVATVAPEQRAGFARVGVPHVVLLLPHADALRDTPVQERGRSIRQSVALAPDGANVNWVAPKPGGGWAYRTYERGVEGETLACGTGAVAAAILLTTWGLAQSPVTLETRSGREVTVTLARPESDSGGGERWQPSLRGEGRLVFRGTIESLPGA